MNKNYFSFFCLIVLLLFIISLFAPRKSGIFLKEEYRDTTIFNVTYRDTIIYNVHKKDSVITDYTLVPLHDSIIINDTVYIVLPLSAYHFSDSLADIYVTGYNVTLDSFLLHRKEVRENQQQGACRQRDGKYNKKCNQNFHCPASSLNLAIQFLLST